MNRVTIAEDDQFTKKTLTDWTTMMLEDQGIDTGDIGPERIGFLLRTAMDYVLPTGIKWNDSAGTLSYDTEKFPAVPVDLDFNLAHMAYVALATVTSTSWRPLLLAENIPEGEEITILGFKPLTETARRFRG